MALDISIFLMAELAIGLYLVMMELIRILKRVIGMRYVIQRIVHNDIRWRGPSIGRLKSHLDKGYVHDHGFAHEDWNFSKDVIGRHVYGYAYFWPRNTDESVSIAFATYEKGGNWTLAGFYDDAQYVEGGVRFPANLLSRRADQLVALQVAGSLGAEYRNLAKAEIVRMLAKEGSSYRWRANVQDVHGLSVPIPVPAGLLPSKLSRYFTRPTDLAPEIYGALKKLSKGFLDVAPVSDYEDGGEIEFPEGRKLQEMHIRRERNRALVIKFKRWFKEKNGRVFCQVCDFDFAKKYGQLGVDFIEAHHKIPVHQLKESSRTKLADLACVCSNCHRMLHKTGTSMSVETLRTIVRSTKR